MQCPLWLWAALQDSCSAYSGLAIQDSFDLVAPSSQHRARQEPAGGTGSSLSPEVHLVTASLGLVRSRHMIILNLRTVRKKGERLHMTVDQSYL